MDEKPSESSPQGPSESGKASFETDAGGKKPDDVILASVVSESAQPASQATETAGQGMSPPPVPWKEKTPRLPANWREPIAVLALVALCDLTIFRGHGWAGYALLFVAAPLLLCLGAMRPRFGRGVCVVGAMLAVLAAKMVWCVPWLGWLVLGIGFSLIVAFAVALSGQRPYVLAVVIYASQTIRAGFDRLMDYQRQFGGSRESRASGRWLAVVLPLVTLLAFGMIFIVANPKVLGYVSKKAELFFADVQQWLAHFTPWEVVFWIGVIWISVGLLRPLAGQFVKPESDATPMDSGTEEPAPLFAAGRNTLATVILLFVVYLVFEFGTLWFREFPEGFHYSGYAHQGAAWLTVALGLATVVLSLVFSGPMLRDPRLVQLRRLAWIWSLQNFVLAAAVYNRLGIYVGYNGMTRMRIVGYFGISAVVVGFALVVWKIAKNYSFAWLLRRHLWTLAAALFLLVITPVDTICCRYNVRKILAGDLKPSVQITVHPISSEGVTLLAPLLECKNATIREGVRAMLAERDQQAEATAQERERLGWTTYQMADRKALEWFRSHRAEWRAFAGRRDHDWERRRAAIDAFAKYAYQWY